MHAVGDQAERRVARQQRADQAGLPMVQRRHGVEQVRAHRRARLERRARRRSVSARVAEADHAARRPAACAIASSAPGSSGASVTIARPPSAEPAIDFGSRGRPNAARVVDAAMLGIDERPFDVRPRATPRRRRSCAGRSAARRSTMTSTGELTTVGQNDVTPCCASVRATCSSAASGSTAEGEIDAARAVDLQVDQARRDPAVLDHDVGVEWPFARLDRRDPAGADLDARRRQFAAVGQDAPPQTQHAPGCSSRRAIGHIRSVSRTFPSMLPTDASRAPAAVSRRRFLASAGAFAAGATLARRVRSDHQPDAHPAGRRAAAAAARQPPPRSRPPRRSRPPPRRPGDTRRPGQQAGQHRVVAPQLHAGHPERRDDHLRRRRQGLPRALPERHASPSRVARSAPRRTRSSTSPSCSRRPARTSSTPPAATCSSTRAAGQLSPPPLDRRRQAGLQPERAHRHDLQGHRSSRIRCGSCRGSSTSTSTCSRRPASSRRATATGPTTSSSTPRKKLTYKRRQRPAGLRLRPRQRRVRLPADRRRPPVLART